MSNLLPLLKKDIKQLLTEGRMLLMLALTGFILLSMPFDMFETAAFNRTHTLQIVLDYFLSYYSIAIVLFISYAAIYRVFYREKNNATMPALLATPVSLRRIWLGKSLAVSFVSYIIAVLFSLVFIILANYYAKAPTVLPSPQSILIFFTLIPANTLLIVALSGLLYLIIKDEMKVRIAFFIMIFGTVYLARRGGILGEINPLVFLSALLLLFALTLFILLNFLQNERVVLSMDN